MRHGESREMVIEYTKEKMREALKRDNTVTTEKNWDKRHTPRRKEKTNKTKFADDGNAF
jgi:hypothetical protein